VGLDTKRLGGESGRLSMVAFSPSVIYLDTAKSVTGTVCHDSLISNVFGQPGNCVKCTTHFKRTDSLKVLTLEKESYVWPGRFPSPELGANQSFG
jgi:hypothetical protein